MKNNTLFVSNGVMFVALLLSSFWVSSVIAQPTVPKIPSKVRKDIKVPPKPCDKPDLAVWRENQSLHHKDEFPFEGNCKTCWEKVGIMNMPDMSVWIMNKGPVDAPSSKAKLTYKSGKPPYQQKAIQVDIPALPAGDQHLVTVDVPANCFFQIAEEITLELDSTKSIDECNEDNNLLTYTY